MRIVHFLKNEAKKLGTGLTGIETHPDPRPVLLETYHQLLEVLSHMPNHSVYRQATETLTKQRQATVEKNTLREDIENGIASGLIEEVILQAKDELRLAKKMLEWKPWEDLEVPPPPGQWEYFRKK
ncbi:uncharacterized protein T551_02827 [Pneumocystis jirovecii RU7]|uniref:NADH dehydrogenase [ubiquinone] 1 alpha subcomplex subunit 5 n=1 Tax=Pneumocystis jirovecii (strain RU7) TaxID=1408657 RepID=A0A0W4ZHL4_PNEJ7|nr:uncharacterized protein T551_02827 [Pneumocystis jirovecii RU7]KTW27860.1 hypothetical protein T551_02827 [Pneumocystis jirovecii RU7]